MKPYSKKQIIKLQTIYDSADFCHNFTYAGRDLGSHCSDTKTSFRVWAPLADAVCLRLFSRTASNEFILLRTVSMEAAENGTWYYSEPHSLNGICYRYLVTNTGQTTETTDPYAHACTANGTYSMVVNLPETNPEHWHADHGPVLAKPTDAILYELHIRDLSMHASSGILHKGKFTGLTETGTRNPDGLPTGLDHIKSLGITHVHLLPCFDFSSVDETNPSFNWGYDPANYNLPEGSYSSDPQNGTVRIREMKEMIQAIHAAGLGVILDVVYNHVADALSSHFQQLAPYYYFRIRQDSGLSDGSACGNEIASERPMVRNFLMDSIRYWIEEYHIDGFRFDLMGLLDITTMQAISEHALSLNPHLLLYGEGWTAAESTLPVNCRSLKQNMQRLPRIAAFNDNLRDAIKGSVFDASAKGFVTGKKGLCEDIRYGICGCTRHPQIDLHQVRSADRFWASAPSQSINYVSAHDNLTLWDKLCCSYPSGTKSMRIRRNKLAAAIYLTAQGIPFFQAGEEFLRSKPSENGKGFDENSYRSPDSVNALNWNQLTRYSEVVAYYRGLIAFRKSHPALRLSTADEIAGHLSFLPDVPDNTVGFVLADHAGTDSLKELCVLFNPNRSSVQFYIPNRTWDIYVNDELAGTEPIAQTKGGTVIVPPLSCLILGSK